MDDKYSNTSASVSTCSKNSTNVMSSDCDANEDVRLCNVNGNRVTVIAYGHTLVRERIDFTAHERNDESLSNANGPRGSLLSTEARLPPGDASAAADAAPLMGVFADSPLAAAEAVAATEAAGVGSTAKSQMLPAAISASFAGGGFCCA